MAMFVHLALESDVGHILRVGLRRLRRPCGDFPGGLFAVPVTPDFYLTHQWLRELKRRNRGPLAGVYFRIPDEEPVLVGHYNQPHDWVTAAGAVAGFLAGGHLGWEVIIPRPVAAQEIRRVRRLPQVVGWRYSPTAKGKRPFCGCRFCTRGLYGARRLRQRLGSGP
jgi:hypothetical protein